jgi:hypothetical protein
MLLQGVQGGARGVVAEAVVSDDERDTQVQHETLAEGPHARPRSTHVSGCCTSSDGHIEAPLVLCRPNRKPQTLSP